MPKWKKDAKEFSIRLNVNPTRGIQCFLPKPIFEFLGKPDGVTFVIKGKRVVVVANERVANTEATL